MICITFAAPTFTLPISLLKQFRSTQLLGLPERRGRPARGRRTPSGVVSVSSAALLLRLSLGFRVALFASDLLRQKRVLCPQALCLLGSLVALAASCSSCGRTKAFRKPLAQLAAGLPKSGRGGPGPQPLIWHSESFSSHMSFASEKCCFSQTPVPLSLSAGPSTCCGARCPRRRVAPPSHRCACRTLLAAPPRVTFERHRQS